MIKLSSYCFSDEQMRPFINFISRFSAHTPRRVVRVATRSKLGFTNNVLTSGERPSSPHLTNLPSITATIGFFGTALTSAWAINSYIKNNSDTKKIGQLRVENLDQMASIEKRMIQSATELMRFDEKNFDAASAYAETINIAVARGDAHAFSIYLNNLASLGPVSNNYLALLICSCANQGKASLLKILEEKYDVADLIDQNQLAKDLLSHPDPAYVERLTDQFLLGVGSIKHEGTHAKLAHFANQDAEQASDRVESPLVTGVEPLEDICLMLAYLREQDSVKNDIEKKYACVVAIELFSDQENESLQAYLLSLKAVAENEGQVDSTFIIYGGHFTCGQIRVEKRDDGEFDVKLFYIDSLGSGYGQFAGYYMVPFFEEIFPAKTAYYVSEVKEQHTSKGCSVFSLMHVKDLVNLPETFSQQGKPHSDIFSYIEQYTTETNKAVYSNEDGTKEHLISYRTVLPPLAFSRAKQSLRRPGVEEQEQAVHKKFILGYAGLFLEIRDSPPSRKEEVNEPINALSPMTMQDYMRLYIRPNAQGKEQNEALQHEIAGYGYSVLRWLVKQTPQQIERHTKAFTVTAFADKHHVSEEVDSHPTSHPASGVRN
jgi:hypothetical protein